MTCKRANGLRLRSQAWKGHGKASEGSHNGEELHDELGY